VFPLVQINYDVETEARSVGSKQNTRINYTPTTTGNAKRNIQGGGTQLIRDYSALHGEEIKKTPELLGKKNGRNWRKPRV
jgi:hypothetical protein